VCALCRHPRVEKLEDREGTLQPSKKQLSPALMIDGYIATLISLRLEPQAPSSPALIRISYYM